MNGKELIKYVKKASAGDIKSFGVLYEFYADDLYRFALYNLKNKFEAEDAVQNTAIKAYENLRSLKKPEAFRSWFMKILLNECRKIINMKKELPEQDIKSEYEAENPGEKTEISELMEILSEPAKTVVQLSVFEDCTSKEISEILSIKPSTVRSILSRSLKKLREEYENEV